MCHSSDIPLNQIVQLVRQFPILTVKAPYVTSIPLGAEPTPKPGMRYTSGTTDPGAALTTRSFVQPMSVRLDTNFHRESATWDVINWQILCLRTPESHVKGNT